MGSAVMGRAVMGRQCCRVSTEAFAGTVFGTLYSQEARHPIAHSSVVPLVLYALVHRRERVLGWWNKRKGDKENR